jgi:hypothetical protein
METEIMDEKVNKKPKGTVGGGRAPGQKNILPPLGKSACLTPGGFVTVLDPSGSPD